MILTNQQLSEIGILGIENRLRRLISTEDASINDVSKVDFRNSLSDLIDKAAGYGLITEQQVAAFCLTAWRIGIDFDTIFPAANSILMAEGYSSDARAEGLLNWSLSLISALKTSE